MSCVALLRVEEEVRGHSMLLVFPFISHPISLSITELHSLLCSSYYTLQVETGRCTVTIGSPS